MAALSRILNVLVLIAAAAALFIGLKLSSHREFAQQRGDDYASTITATATALDNDGNSGTAVAGKVSGNLTWQKYEENAAGTKSTADLVVAQAQDIIAQRNAMAEAVANVGATIGADGMDADQLKTVEGYSAQVDAVKARIADVQSRDDALAAKLAAMGDSLGAPVTSDGLLSVETYEDQLAAIATNLDKLQKNHRRHVWTLEQVVDKAAPELGFTKDHFETADTGKVEELLGKMNTLTAAVEENNNLKEDKQRLTAELDEVKMQRDELQKENETLMAQTTPGDDDDDDDDDVVVIPGLVEGTVVSVNYDLNYVILDIGQNVGLQKNATLAIARDKEFICNITITQVYSTRAVADISPDLQQGVVIPGDTAMLLTDF